MTDIIKDIDALVDEQLSRPIVDDYNVNRYPKCPHCNRDWHGLPVTAKIAEMYRMGIYDENYRGAADDSEILCHGSNFIGPMPAKSWTHRSHRLNNDYYRIYTADWREILAGTSIIGPIFNPADRRRWWRTILPSDGQYRHDLEPDTIVVRTGRNFEQSFPAEVVRISEQQDEVMIFQSDRPVRVDTRIIVDVLSETPPRLVGTTTPLTAPGVIHHPDDFELRDRSDLTSSDFAELADMIESVRYSRIQHHE